MLAYELHTFREGRWSMDSVFDDRDLALNEAHRADESRRYAGIRIIEEKHDEETNETTTRVIFRGGTTATLDPPTTPKEKTESGQEAPPAAAAREPERTARPRPEPENRQGGWIVPVAVCSTIVVLVGAVTAMFFLSR